MAERNSESTTQAAAEKDCNPWTSITTIVLVATSVATVAAFLIQQTFHLPAPRCSVVELYVPALDLSSPPQNTSNSTTNPSLFFALELENNLQIRSVSYGGAVALTFYYGRKAVAGYAVPAFYQGRGRAALRRDVVETRGVPWPDALAAVSGGGAAGFRVEMAARPRFKILFWYSKEKNVRIVADVAVDASGMKKEKDDVILHGIEESTAAERGKIRGFFLFPTLLVAYWLLFS